MLRSEQELLSCSNTLVHRGNGIILLLYNLIYSDVYFIFSTLLQLFFLHQDKVNALYEKNIILYITFQREETF